MIAPLIARAITTREAGHYPQPSETFGYALEAHGNINSESDTSALDLSRYMAASAYESGAVSAIYTPESPKKAPVSDVQAIIEEVYGKNHIMYWVAVNESALDPYAASGSGAEGVMQITQGTWKAFKCTGIHFNARDNVLCSKKIYDANGLKDWRWSEHEGSEGGWAKHLSTSTQ